MPPETQKPGRGAGLSSYQQRDRPHASAELSNMDETASPLVASAHRKRTFAAKWDKDTLRQALVCSRERLLRSPAFARLLFTISCPSEPNPGATKAFDHLRSPTLLVLEIPTEARRWDIHTACV
jgi:hypothetical protein